MRNLTNNPLNMWPRKQISALRGSHPLAVYSTLSRSVLSVRLSRANQNNTATTMSVQLDLARRLFLCFKSSWRQTLVVSFTALWMLLPVHAIALEFRSVAINKAILYDAPSTEAQKLYVIGNGYPVEVIVNLGEWIKIRDHFGTLSWIQGKQLSTKRMALVVSDKTDLKQSEEDSAALLATFEKDVVVEVLSGAAKSGWVKVKHRDGLTGFVRNTALWGI